MRSTHQYRLLYTFIISFIVFMISFSFCSGGVVIYFDRIEVVNQLQADSGMCLYKFYNTANIVKMPCGV